MKNIIIVITILLATLNSYSQEDKASFRIDDIIYVANSQTDKAYEFLKSRHFTYLKKDTTHQCFVYGLNYNEYSNSATMWVYKYENGQLKIQSPETHRKVIEKQLESFKKSTKIGDDGTVTIKYFYKNRPIQIIINDTKNVSEIYID